MMVAYTVVVDKPFPAIAQDRESMSSLGTRIGGLERLQETVYQQWYAG